jgi:hypothetical protein
VRLAQQLLPATNIPAVPLDLMDKECPEILRLQLGRGRVSQKKGRVGYGGMGREEKEFEGMGWDGMGREGI